MEILIDTPGEDADSLRTPATAQFLGYQRALSGLRGVRVGPLPQLPDDPTVLSYLIAATMIIDLREKHSLLAAADTATRLRREQALLRREALLIQELRSLPAVDLPAGLTGEDGVRPALVGGFAGRSQPRLIAATVAEVSRTRSAGASSISSPRRPAEQKTVSKPTAEASTTVRSGLRCPSGEIPPST